MRLTHLFELYLSRTTSTEVPPAGTAFAGNAWEVTTTQAIWITLKAEQASPPCGMGLLRSASPSVCRESTRVNPVTQ